MILPPLPRWLPPVGILLCGLLVVTIGQSIGRWLTAHQQAETLESLHQDLAVQRLALATTGAALSSERATTAQLKSALFDERGAVEEAERRRSQSALAYQALLAKQEQLEHENPDVKAWADQPVPAGVSRLLGEARAHYRDPDRDDQGDAAGGLPAGDPATGAKPPD